MSGQTDETWVRVGVHATLAFRTLQDYQKWLKDTGTKVRLNPGNPMLVELTNHHIVLKGTLRDAEQEREHGEGTSGEVPT